MTGRGPETGERSAECFPRCSTGVRPAGRASSFRRRPLWHQLIDDGEDRTRPVVSGFSGRDRSFVLFDCGTGKMGTAVADVRRPRRILQHELRNWNTSNCSLADKLFDPPFGDFRAEGLLLRAHFLSFRGDDIQVGEPEKPERRPQIAL